MAECFTRRLMVEVFGDSLSNTEDILRCVGKYDNAGMGQWPIPALSYRVILSRDRVKPLASSYGETSGVPFEA